MVDISLEPPESSVQFQEPTHPRHRFRSPLYHPEKKRQQHQTQTSHFNSCSKRASYVEFRGIEFGQLLVQFGMGCQPRDSHSVCGLHFDGCQRTLPPGAASVLVRIHRPSLPLLIVLGGSLTRPVGVEVQAWTWSQRIHGRCRAGRPILLGRNFGALHKPGIKGRFLQ